MVWYKTFLPTYQNTILNVYAVLHDIVQHTENNIVQHAENNNINFILTAI